TPLFRSVCHSHSRFVQFLYTSFSRTYCTSLHSVDVCPILLSLSLSLSLSIYLSPPFFIVLHVSLFLLLSRGVHSLSLTLSPSLSLSLYLSYLSFCVPTCLS